MNSGKALRQCEGACAKPQAKVRGESKLDWFGGPSLSEIVLSQSASDCAASGLSLESTLVVRSSKNL